MMAMKISYDDLQIISSCLTSVKDDDFTKSLDNFLKERKDDYYFCGRDVKEIQSLEITIRQLGRIVSYVDLKKYKTVYENINSVYQAALGSSQDIVFLYGRKEK